MKRSSFDQQMVPPALSQQLCRALEGGMSRREALRMLGMTGVAAAAALGWPGSGMLAHAQEKGEGEPRRGGSIRVAAHSSSALDTLDPAKGTTAIDYIRHAMFYNTLTEFDEQLVPQPGLAERFETTDDGTTWVFSLRHGIRFHDGKPFTPEDVVFSINRHKVPANGSKMIALVRQILEVRKSGDHEVTMVLEAPNIELPALLAISHLMMLAENTTDFSTAVGTGPFRCQEFRPGVRSVAVRNDEYWKPGLPWLDAIETVGISDNSARLNALLSGDIQLTNNIDGRSAARVEASSSHALKSVNSGTYTNLIVRVDQQPGSRPDFVEAMKCLLDREQIRRRVFNGYAEIGNDQPIASSNRYYFADLPQREYDPEQAASLLKKAGVAGARIQVVASPAAKGSEDIAVLLQQSAQQAGLNLMINRVPSEGYWTNHWMKHPLCFGNVLPRPTANVLLSQFFQSTAPWNESGWKNEQFDQLLVASRREADDTRRRQMYADMQTLIHEQCGVGIPVFVSDIDGYDTRLKGYDRTIPLGNFMGYTFPEHVWWEA